MEININQAREFITLLTGDVDTPVTFQVFYDPKNEVQRPDLAKNWVATLADSLDFIKYSQSQLCGVYVGLNESDGKGHENSNIVSYRCVFADFDGTEEPDWGLKPHFVHKRDDTHGHAFWLVSDITTADEFKALQRRIAVVSDTDLQVCYPARVARLTGSVHYKDPAQPAMYMVTDDNTDGDHKYTMADIQEGFSVDATQDAEITRWVETRGGILDGTGYDHNERYINQTKNWLTNLAPPAIEGEGSHTVFKVAAYGHDHGVPLDVMQELMWENYNSRCLPPWHEADQNQFSDIIERSYRYPTSAAGCKTAVAGFSSCDALPEPIGGWEANKEVVKDTPIPFEAVEINDNGRLAKDVAAGLLAQVNSKSPHFDQALIIDGVLWNGKNIIRSEKIFYTYTGEVWKELTDDSVKAKIQRFFSNYKPSDTFIRGVYSLLCNLVHVESVQNGTWIDEDVNRNADNVIVFKNGIVDLSSDNPVLEPHNRNFFSFSMRSYKYNPDAKCPEMIKFLGSTWDEDQKLKMQLQEWMGYLMTSSVKLEKFAVLIGFSRGGKGVITKLIRKMVGDDNTCAPTLSSLIKDHSLYNMSTRSLALIPDAHTVNFNSRDAVLSNFKAITGGDPMTYDVKYAPSQTKILKVRFMLSTNNMPEFNDPSGALANRMLVFPFYKSFKGKENTNLLSELTDEIEGIAIWALEGLKRLRANGGKFTESETGLIEKEDIREDMFPLAQYVNTMCEIKDGAKTSTGNLFSAYLLWCSMNTIKNQMSELQFSKMLRNSELHLTPTRTYLNGHRVRGFEGIQLSVGCMEKLAMGNSNIVPFTKVEEV